ncbi:MAG: hypothetical protein AVDCRST_MAG64-3615 [uncultured Phycisphaerae bacterium]|uniref:Uncharacterized protein n=1 Tax=uncultured Phycisphaerae bacterium TaxID=904963 RepID=A0A6J4Q2C9_9BACT|nr:MAG: hypothetical protein AVDCRST_MAG64-3615 [uncultured Phycisphaerae bacterium]
MTTFPARVGASGRPDPRAVLRPTQRAKPPKTIATLKTL